MSQENVEIVRQYFAFGSEGDWDAARALTAADVEWIVGREHPETRTLVGRDAVRDYRLEWERIVPDVRFALERVLDHGEEVVGIGSVSGTGTSSRANVRVPLAFVFGFRNGLIARVEEYLTHAEALKAVGLEE
jgi:uncharacterized protein